ncbi:DUF6789 family protein [Haloarchaeobius sp. HRN-SO-5]|uniref:DUF6789 family protein n=1 Tax=Haloarchaeobius sp. HRN-SO-5 TaxID=3446118 RepID=UPI003EC05D78
MAESHTTDEDVTTDEFERVDGADELRTAASAVAGGIVGTTVMTGVLLAVNAVYAPEISVFATLAELAGVGSNVALGIAMFVGAGALAWPLLFATIGAYLPGATRIQQGIVFALVLWVGFIVAFGTLYSGVDLVVFLATSIATHVAYGYILGFVSGRLTGNHERARVAV